MIIRSVTAVSAEIPDLGKALLALVSKVCGITAFGLLGAWVMPSAVWALLALFLFVWFFLELMRLAPVSATLMLALVFFRFIMFISGLFVEMGTFMPEIGVTGQPTGASLRLLLLYVPTMAVMCGLAEPALRRMGNAMRAIPAALPSAFSASQVRGFFVLYMGLLYLFLLYVGAKHGFPFFDMVDRFYFKFQVDSPIFNTFLHDRPIYAAILSLCMMSAPRSKQWLFLAIFAAMMAFSVLFGEKFASIFTVLIAFIIPIAVIRAPAPAQIRRYIGLVAIAGVCITPILVLWTYGWAEDSALAMERFMSRIASQAQLWYLADGGFVPVDSENSWASLGNMLRSLVAVDAREVTVTPPFSGMAFLMYGYLTGERLHYFETGITLAMGFEAYLLTVFGWLGVVPVMLLLGIPYAGAMLYFGYAVLSRDVVRVVLAMKMLIWANVTFTQGDLWYMLGLRMAALVAIAAVYEAAMRRAGRSGMLVLPSRNG